RRRRIEPQFLPRAQWNRPHLAPLQPRQNRVSLVAPARAQIAHRAKRIRGMIEIDKISRPARPSAVDVRKNERINAVNPARPQKRLDNPAGGLAPPTPNLRPPPPPRRRSEKHPTCPCPPPQTPPPPPRGAKRPHPSSPPLLPPRPAPSPPSPGSRRCAAA